MRRLVPFLATLLLFAMAALGVFTYYSPTGICPATDHSPVAVGTLLGLGANPNTLEAYHYAPLDPSALQVPDADLGTFGEVM